MPSIANSAAVFTLDRVFPQHQAALTIVKDRVESPAVQTFRWLDLACGRGQILANAEHVLGTARKKIEYTGIDVNQTFALQAQRLAESLFPKAVIHISELSKFEAMIEQAQLFDFVTFTNAAHEILPDELATTLVAALCRIECSGQFYMYDMESLAEPELGAITWKGAEMGAVMKSIMTAAGEATYCPEPAVWPHKTCKGWSIHVNRQHIGHPTDHFNGAKALMVTAAANTIVGILRQKLVDIDSALDALRRFGSSTPEEAREATALSFQFWAIVRALQGVAQLGSE